VMQSADKEALMVKKAWDLAITPAKALPMQAIMMYMSGSTPQIFSMTMTFMLFQGPIKAIFGIGSAFSRFESAETHSRLWGPKIVYILLYIFTMAVGVWKCSSMGLLPMYRSDWLAWETPRIAPTHVVAFEL